MATLETDEANLLDAETVNWKLIVFPVVAVIAIVVIALAIYYYQLEQREELEATARTALLAAKTPEDLLKVADQYPTTTQAALALLSAGDMYFAKQDYANALTACEKVASLPHPDEMLAGSARLGIAAAYDASGKLDDAIAAYVREGDLGAKNPYAPYAYYAAAQLCEEKGDKDNERRILTEAASLDPDSQFVKQAQYKLKEMAAAEQPPDMPAAGSPPSAAPDTVGTPPAMPPPAAK